jgi:rare lipoprotein A
MTMMTIRTLARTFAMAMLALCGLVTLDTTPARADWREAILGQKIYGGESAAPRASRPARTASVERAARPARNAVRMAAAEAPEPRTARSSGGSRSGLARPERALSRPIYGGGSGSEQGVASYYWQPQALASGGRFNPNAMTAAHKTLPFGTRVRVTDKSSGRSVVVTINDRGPYIRGRIIDLSKAAAGSLGITGRGVAPVSVERI